MVKGRDVVDTRVSLDMVQSIKYQINTEIIGFLPGNCPFVISLFFLWTFIFLLNK